MLISNHAVAAVSRLYAGSQSAGMRRLDAAGAVQRPDALELSGEAQSFGDILQKLRGIDDVRSERVEALRAREQEPAPADIAAKMLAMRY
ncbi:flagellar protein FlgM [Centipeda periodontii DSM 2778]|uniref:Flagellar protein FlgM n=1 Tax=Centipeda periodontii DSM 2778 TaxID=888060 RepID=F5RIX8_9FIRM|nr:flagellar biosynthesis anti-sigma factor FlgM [Centipeda periodontii]EGK62416.1 flagellar protein FlgM [Centipeda periodontii DSM 2778]